MSGTVRCAVRQGKFVEPCAPLQSVLAPRRGKAPGLELVHLYNRAEQTRAFVVLFGGEYLDRGVAINCCPFCGAQINAPFVEPVAND